MAGPPGAYFDAVLHASAQVECYDDEFGFEPVAAGIRTLRCTAGQAARLLTNNAGAEVFTLLVGYPLRAEPPSVRRERIWVHFGPQVPEGADFAVGARGSRPQAGKAAVVAARDAAKKVACISLPRGPGRLLFVSVDPFVMDPSLFTAPGNIEPGGLDWYALTGALRHLLSRRPAAVQLLPRRLLRRDPVPAYVLARLAAKVLAAGLAGK